MACPADLRPLPYRFRVAASILASIVILVWLFKGRDDTEVRFQDWKSLTSVSADESKLPSIDGSSASQTVEADDACDGRFGVHYLDAFVKTATSYCDEDSTASLTCFSHKIHQKIDSFCIGAPAIFNETGRPIRLDCNLQELSPEDKAQDVPNFNQFPTYWYNTGPRAIFKEHIELSRITAVETAEDSGATGFSFLVQREDNNQNLWHTMMEIMSLTLSLDVLRAAIDPGTGQAFFQERDVESAQVVFLDNLADGPYYDMWSMFASKPPIRLNRSSATHLATTKIVVPLPGSSNPFWQGAWLDLHCGESELLKTFAQRVIEFYHISDNGSRKERPLTLTFIDRKQKRRLLHKEEYFQKLMVKHPDIVMRMVDFAEMSLAEQIETAHSADILVGVHGAGLTHGMFQQTGATLVEILPPNIEHKGFANMANALGNRYLSDQAIEHESSEDNGDWQHDDIFMDEDQFLKLMDLAITGNAG